MAVTNLGDDSNLRTGTTDPWTFSSTVPTGTIGVAVGISHGTSSTDHVNTVSLASLSFSEIVRATDTATETGASEFWFMSDGAIPTGSQTFSIDLASATGDDLLGVVWYIGSNLGRLLEVADFDSINNDLANPTVTLSKGGRSGFCVCQMYGGAAAPGGTLAAGNTLDATADHTAFYSQSCHETTIDTADHTIGWSTLGLDDLAFVAMCVVEQAGPNEDQATLNKVMQAVNRSSVF